jgi:hypothetical protein
MDRDSLREARLNVLVSAVAVVARRGALGLSARPAEFRVPAVIGRTHALFARNRTKLDPAARI